MLQYAALFEPCKLDVLLADFIEQQPQDSSFSAITLLAQEVLLGWALSQPSSMFDEAAATTLLKALKVLVYGYLPCACLQHNE